MIAYFGQLNGMASGTIKTRIKELSAQLDIDTIVRETHRGLSRLMDALTPAGCANTSLVTATLDRIKPVIEVEMSGKSMRGRKS